MSGFRRLDQVLSPITDRMAQVEIHPSIRYSGTPAVVMSTVNEDETTNLAPFSSAFWLGWRAILGISARSRTARNLRRAVECVLNLSSVREAAAVGRLTLTTGTNPVAPRKVERGYRYEPDKFGASGFAAVPSPTVRPPRGGRTSSRHGRRGRGDPRTKVTKCSAEAV